MTDRYDVIIVRTGAGGGTLAHTLAPSGKKILLTERGDFLPRELANWDADAVFVDGRYISPDTWYDSDGKAFQPQVHYFVGGATKMYGAALYRLRPADFGEIKFSDGTSPAWPLDYGDLEPYYTRAEWLYQVHGDHGEDPTEGPASKQYPWPPVSHEPRIQQLSDVLAAAGYHPFHAPCEILLDEGHRAASTCIRCAWVDGYPCFVHAKSDADIIAVRPLLGLPNVTLLVGAEVTQLRTDAAGRSVTEVIVSRSGQQESYSADIVVPAAGAANTAKILLRSPCDQHPAGLANGSDQVGRNYMFHNSKAVAALAKDPNETVYQKTLGLNDFYLADGSRPPLGNIQLLGKSNPGAMKGEEPQLTKLAPHRSLEEVARHSVDIWLTTPGGSGDLTGPPGRGRTRRGGRPTTARSSVARQHGGQFVDSNRYPNIADHGLIGDLQTAALVTVDGTIDWFCCPRFDSPSVFASLLDADKGGHFQIASENTGCVTKQLYLPGTAVLVTRFMTADGVGELFDFMLPLTGRATDRHRLVRMLRVPRGTVRFRMDMQPRFDYGRAKHKTELSSYGAVISGTDGMRLTVHMVGSGGAQTNGSALKRSRRGLRASWTLREGETAGVMIDSMTGPPKRMRPADLDRMLDEASNFWRDWLQQSSYTGRWRERVSRSAMTLKLLTYHPTGAPVAAATTGLPEDPGGGRNWDYRYTWLRDASFSIYALLGLGYRQEAAKFGVWLRERAAEQAGKRSGPLKIMYRVDGSSDLREATLRHLEGWRGAKPVRIGNGAADQLQLDVYGEVMDALYMADQTGFTPPQEGWMAVADVIDWLCEHWDQPDEGIWEARSGRKDFTYGRFQSWIALDRAIRIAGHHARPAEIDRWTMERDRIYNEIMDRGWNPRIKAFTQCYDSDVLDASLLLMPLQGFIAPGDPMWLSTLEAMDKTLVSDSLVYRYNPSMTPDGQRGSEGTFSLCTFWYVDALARAGRLRDAELTFEKMLTYANHVGLYSEEIGQTGEQLGNFPQALSHLALIGAAINLDYQLDHGAGLVGPVFAPAR